MKFILTLALLFLLSPSLYSFQTESTSDPVQIVEAGRASPTNVPGPFYYLSQYNYKKALALVSDSMEGPFPWIKGYLEGLLEVWTPLVRYESDYFVLYVPKNQEFLKDYVLPTLEAVGRHLEEALGHRPAQKIQVEIYPNKEDFSKASTLSLETLKRSGAIGICKFHRLMIMSPQSLPLGYRWLDALSHEYVHLMVNELTHSKAELWLHEGTARYFETSFRASPPLFLSPHQKTKLMEAIEEEKLISFKRMSPSLVYLKDQDEVIFHLLVYLL